MRMIKLADRYYNDFAINKIAILKSSPGTPFVLGGGIVTKFILLLNDNLHFADKYNALRSE